MKIAAETDLIATTWFPLTALTRALVLAPHPDDEVFACGGTLRRLVEAGVRLTVVVISDGALGGPPQQAGGPADRVAGREAESAAAAAVLGYPAPQFWRLADRGLRYGETLIARLQRLIEDCDPDLILAPACTEIHPDHQVVAFAAAEAVRRAGGERCLAGYEIGAPTTASLLVDITAQLDAKKAAIACFASQLAEQPYDDRMLALNRYRAYPLGAQALAAEAFHCRSAAELRTGQLVPPTAWGAWRRRLELAAGPEDLPLVSVIVRSMDRPTLVEALDSVALQTWPNIEIVLVNARGADHAAPPADWGELPLRFIAAERNVSRAAAANRGLDAARGRYLMFLDDDDWLDANHVQRLVEALAASPQFGVAYTDVRCVDQHRQPLPQTFATPFHAARLLAGNFIPIHAALFDRGQLASGCRVDESLSMYEDWDFWLQLAAGGDFLHVAGASAVYRITPQAGFGVNADQRQTEPLRQKIYRKWLGRLGAGQIDRLVRTIHEDELKEERIAALSEEVAGRERDLARLQGEVAALRQTLDGSVGWRIEQRVRRLAHLAGRGRRELPAVLRRRLRRHGRQVYDRLPESVRTPALDWAFRRLGWMFRGMPRYELWRSGRAGGGRAALCGQYLVAPGSIEPAAAACGRIAVHLHLYYHDLVTEFAARLKHMPFAYDLYVSVADETGERVCRQALSALPHLDRLVVERVPNRGRDIAPMFCTFGERLQAYDFVAHLHGKKSLYNEGATAGWREYLCDALLGDEMRLRRIFTLLQGESPHGIVYPQNFRLLPWQANTWLSNRARGAAWCRRLGIDPVPQGYFHLPAGTMFWARTDALRPLFRAGITLDDFDEERGQTDGTFAHCLERLLVPAAIRSGRPPAILRDVVHPRWSAWNFEQYLARSRESLLTALDDPAIRVIAFDIFDTLLCRPLLDAESVKAIVAQRAGGEPARGFVALRAQAEAAARDGAGRDVGLDAIYASLGRLTGWPAQQLAHLRALEEETEYASVAARSEAVALYRHALAGGRPVALVSDMFLPRTVVERMLRDHGIDGWDRLFLSGEEGVRKDDGRLYERVLAHYAVQPGQMLMVGDSEHADWQVPLDRGIRSLHLLRPVELARALPRLQPVVDAGCRGAGDIGADAAAAGGNTGGRRTVDEELTLGLVIRKNFSPVCFPRLDPASLIDPEPENIGYGLVGPLLVAMSQWLLESAVRDGIDRLYFLSREGQLIRQVFDLWTEGLESLPQSRYLVVSRRAVSVATIGGLDDILAIARTPYFPNTLASFVLERYGVRLDGEGGARAELDAGRLVEVRDRNADALRPLLAALEEDIRARARTEAGALRRYLGAMGLDDPGRQAVVDVGYGGTIQDHLNRLSATPVHGYYLMTSRDSAGVARRHGVHLRACYRGSVDPAQAPPLLFRQSFELEKLLSSSDAQLVHYECDGQRQPVARHRALSPDERACAPFRDRLQQGVLQYAHDARALRDRLYPAFRPSVAAAVGLLEAFLARPSPAERAALRSVCLDDHYCGRDVVR